MSFTHPPRHVQWHTGFTPEDSDSVTAAGIIMPEDSSLSYSETQVFYRVVPYSKILLGHSEAKSPKSNWIPNYLVWVTVTPC